MRSWRLITLLKMLSQRERRIVLIGEMECNQRLLSKLTWLKKLNKSSRMSSGLRVNHKKRRKWVDK